ncbi:phospholipid carrier-dependent glycosyltransferase [Nakamurella sp. YIM 132087]|uniref:Polyprenol-phosphate-mannose--protein mannosyltransferase n=1 Tax=Nakamurella alba TaxID=2665158 RepID=A0A7K1FHB9_9ACTN|nr:phospholipid carrier-dependent glycosyltransferase [Nakamurella alba]MTD12683.1 phospholipid carrier-dependent glycosyltransferase [Nakamurella alba]
MTAPPAADAAADDRTEHDTPPGPLGPDDLVARPTVLGLDEDDLRQSRPDPARGVVAIGEVPPFLPPVRPERRRPTGLPSDRARGWLVTGLLTLIGGVLRFVGLGNAVDGGSSGGVGTPLFDEKYYAVQAAEVMRNLGVEDNQAYGVVVHPPLGKQLIAIGEWLFGYNSFGWRFSSAVAGTIIILLVIRVVRRMTSSTLIGGIAGVLIICDSLSHVLARAALLDVFQELFVIAAFACLIADRDQVRARLEAATFGGFLHEPAKGPGFWARSGERAGIALGARWWRFGCGICLGLATGIKYSGIYWVAAFGILTIIWDILARKEAGVRRPVAAVVRRDLAPGLWSLAVIPIGTYIASWWAWFFSETAFPRNVICTAEGNPCGAWDTGFFKWLAGLWDNTLWTWTWRMLDFHSTLLTPDDVASRHPWESKPWTWPMGLRPVLTYVGSNMSCGDGSNDCVARIFIISLPAMWFLAFFVLAWALWRAIGRTDWRYAAVLVGYGAGYIPWFANLDRQMYFFYAASLAPFLVIGISLVLGDILGRAKVGMERRYLLIAMVSLYVGIVVANFLWMLPILNGDPITQSELTARTIIPPWG